MTQIVLNIEDNSVLPILKKLISSLKVVTISAVENSKVKTSWVDGLGEGWKDDRTTDQIISDIKESRTANKEIDL